MSDVSFHFHVRVLYACIAGAVLAAGGFLAGRHTAHPTASRVPEPTPHTGLPAAAHRNASAFPHPAAAPVADDANPDALETLLASATTPAAEEAFLDRLSALARTDPAHALRLAQAAATPRLRTLCLHAALRGWAGADALAAGRWALENMRLGERRSAVEAIVQGAAGRPDEAVRAVSFLCSKDPALAGDHGNTLVAEFARLGRFDLAGRFAADGPVEHRAWWLATAFGRWAQYQPDAALAALDTFADPAVREAATQGLITGWAAADPAALVARAQSFPSGELRNAALRDGLRQWVDLDPGAASAWLEHLDPAPDLDAGAAALATTPALVARRPDVAAGWAESIVDAPLRAETLLDLIRLWAETDPAAARRYAAGSAALSAETRTQALTSFDAPP